MVNLLQKKGQLFVKKVEHVWIRIVTYTSFLSVFNDIVAGLSLKNIYFDLINIHQIESIFAAFTKVFSCCKLYCQILTTSNHKVKIDQIKSRFFFSVHHVTTNKKYSRKMIPGTAATAEQENRKKLYSSSVHRWDPRRFKSNVFWHVRLVTCCIKRWNLTGFFMPTSSNQCLKKLTCQPSARVNLERSTQI